MDSSPKYLLRDRDRIYGDEFRKQVDAMNIEEDSYFTYYHRSRLHLSLDKDSPDSRPVHSVGRIIGLPEVGGLHHRYERRVA